MNLYDLLFEPAEQLIQACEDRPIPWPSPIKCDSFIARSAMQKAIRRGDCSLALRAAATVMTTNPAVVWRRLLVTALEDLGIYQVGLLTKIAAAIERRRLGHRDQDEWQLIAQIVRDCCTATRCQSANDLQNLALHHRRYDDFRAGCARLAARDLLAVAADPDRDLIERHIAVLTCMGNEHAPWVLSRRLVEPEVIIGAIGARCGSGARALYLWALRKTGLALATASILLLDGEGTLIAVPMGVDDDLPVEAHLGEIPSYAVDQYTRVGRAAIGDFVSANEAWKRFADRLELTRSTQLKAVGELIFRTEGATVTQRASWDVARILRDQSLPVGCFVPEEAVDEGFALIRSEIPNLHRFRAARLAGALHKPN